MSLSLCSDLLYDIASMLFYSPFALTSVAFDGVALLATLCGSIACSINCFLRVRRVKSLRYPGYAYQVDSRHALNCQDYLLKVLDDLYVR